MAKETFTDAEQALIEKMVYGVIDRVMPKIEKAIQDGITSHARDCETAKEFAKAKATGKGFVVGFSIFGLVLTAAVGWLWVKVLTHVFQ